jgi:uncharacterized membrane protein YidH (DUF202 family)
MNKTALNLIAVGVFIMTLSFFLTPIFNISPAIPTLVTFIILGFFTVDTLALENKGTNLFLDSFTSKEDRQRIIIHEAGHFLTAYLLDIPITDYSLTAWDAFKKGQKGQGGVTFSQEILFKQPIKSSEMSLILDRFSTVLMAGIGAESLYYKSVEGGAEDRQQLKLILKSLGIPNLVFSQKENWAKLQAINLIKKNESAYLALVDGMKNQLSVTECCQVIQGNLNP